ncbi:MAG: bifunctional (p)ppGpp synthetase/guanosine-3',5'-bis(diphosphate) 3'-pyrophosphohydrolase [Clostridia bacterium]|nr:bifunctional (p)ppGpp synthetase/guanosine-3',5'-bis(diphosphate) 3'-pyrophosphohydrolase [Clostridia bacterium]
MLSYQELYETLLSDIQKSHSGGNIEIVQKAFQFALKAHGNQKRVSGEDYICHPLQVAIIISNMLLDCDTIAAGILHDTVEDTDVSFHDLELQFGKNVALMVDGVTKLGKIQFDSQEEAQIENLRKMFMSTARDLRVMLIKLADRLHNMRTMDVMPDHKRRQKSKETIEIFAPIAERLGMFKIKAELENLALKYLDPIAYAEIADSLKDKMSGNSFIDTITSALENKLTELNINGSVSGRIKHVYSIFKKTYMQGRNIDEIYDIFAVRIIVKTIPECYAVLGVIHDLYTPIPGRIKDYIAIPKPNLYQSLHTTVIGRGGVPFEIQIRTEEMHRIAEYGIAAHWKYKDGIDKDKDESKFTHLRELLEIQGSLTDSEEFMQTLKTDIFADEVFVFTPKGDVISLPTGSCPIDFAYAIHSAIGSKMTGAKVNGKLVPLYYPLKNGDIVNVITSSTVHGPSRDWLKLVRTSNARQKINQWFKREKRDENIVRGKEIFEKEIKKSGFSYSQIYNENIVNQEIERNHFSSSDDLFAAIGYGGIPASRIVSKLTMFYKQELAKLSPEEKTTVFSHKTSSNGVIVTGIDNCLVRLSRCCNPVPGDDIVGYITRGRGVSVHRKDCVNVINNFVGEGETDRLIEVQWEEKPSSTSYLTEMHITADDRTNLLADIMVVISEFRIPTHSCNARVTKDNVGIIVLTVEVNSSGQLDSLMKKLMSVRGVIQVSRTMQ